MLELRRTDRRHLAARLLALAAAIAALAALALAPARTVRRAGTRAVLVTQGADAADAARIADSVQAALVIRPADSTRDAEGIKARLPAVRELVVAGWGLDSARLPELAGLAVSFVPSPLPPGVIHAAWPDRITEGDELVVQGRLKDAGGAVSLVAPDGSAYSVRAGDAGSFTLRLRPRARGFTRFLLRSAAGTDTIGVQVVPPRPLRLLVLQGAPDYESSRLRDWVSRRGGSVAMRTRISAGRRRTEGINTGGALPERITATLLRQFDIAAIDAASLRALSPAERVALDMAVRDEGLGLLVDPESPPFGASAGPAGARSGRIRLGAGLAPAVTLSPAALQGRSMVPGAARSVLFRDEAGNAVAEWRPVGAGRVATTLVQNPSRWTLGGDGELFDRYWAGLLGALARPGPGWAVSGGGISRPGEPVRLERQGTVTGQGAVIGQAIVLRPDGAADTVALDPGPDSTSWAGVYWPHVAGRHLVAGHPDSAWFSVTAVGTWTGVRAARSTDATMAWIALHGPGADSPARDADRVPYPRWWFVGAFLAGASWLWWERRRVTAG
jgi:hypothetical protein